MVTTPLEEFFSLRAEVQDAHSPLGVLVTTRRSPHEQRPRGNDASSMDAYEYYEPVKPIYVFLEPANTSPFMDA